MSARSMTALAVANGVRLPRAELKRQIKDGARTVDDVLSEMPACVQSMRVIDLLVAQRQWGRKKAEKVMRHAQLSESKTFEGLLDQQVARLRRELAAA